MQLKTKKKINVLIVGKNSLLCKIFVENTNLKNFSLYSRKSLKKIDFSKYSHIINFSFNPILKKGKYKKKFDLDFKLYKSIKKYSIIYIMISTRLVYSNSKKILTENTKTYKPITWYGKNKLIIEKNIKKKLPSKYLIIRLSNILYDNITIKKNLFFYNVLKNLKLKNKIFLNFHSSTFKDFITPKYFSICLDKLILLNASGTFNLCSGLKIKVEDIIKKIIVGHGSGDFLYTSKNHENESFVMCNKKLLSKVGINLSLNKIINYSLNMGKKLRNE